MYHIGYIALSDHETKEYFNTLESSQNQLHRIESAEKIVLSNLNFDILVLQDDNNEHVGKIWEFIFTYRQKTKALIWIISKEMDKVTRNTYLRLGADTLYGRESSPEEMLLSIENQYKRQQLAENTHTQQKDRVAPPEKAAVRLNSRNLSVIIDDEEISLTKLEFQVMEFLYENAREAVSYEEIYRRLWNDSSTNRKYRVSNLIFHLRTKFEKARGGDQLIKTVHTKGYMLNI